MTRNPTRFSAEVLAYYGAYQFLTRIPYRDYFLQPEACAELFQRGRAMVKERFGGGPTLQGVTTPPISYGHLSGVGAELRFPEDGEVAVKPKFGSVREGIEALRQPVDFARAGMTPFYVEFHQRLKALCPGESVSFGYSHNGPITSAYLLRGREFFLDLYDQPAEAREYIALVAASILGFRAWKMAYLGMPTGVREGPAFLTDDGAAMIAPSLWREFVLPAWDRFYRGITTGPRHVHCEGLTAEHLPLLEEAQISWFDPFVSPKLTPALIQQRCGVPFQWGLPTFRFADMTCRDVEDYVFQAAADGAEHLFTEIDACVCHADAVPKVHAFLGAAQRVRALLDQGTSRADLARHVNRRDFWAWWRAR